MTRKLETTIAQVQSALEASIPGWAETSFILDASAAHELLGLVQRLYLALMDASADDGLPDSAMAMLDEVTPWLSDNE